MAKSKGIAGKIVAGALALCVAASCVSLLGYTSRDNNGNWFGGLHWADNNITADGGDVKNENGNTIVNEVDSNGIRLMSTMIAEEDYDAYGISAMAESATIITATFTPAATTNKNVTWSCSDTSGKVTVTPVSGNPLQATVTVTGAFGTQVTITCTSEANSAIKASCTVDYVKNYTYKNNNITLSSIKGVINSQLMPNFGTGTLNPTSCSGMVYLSIDFQLYNYLKTKHSTVKQDSNISTTADILSNPQNYYLKELFGTTSESEINSIYEDIAIYYYGKSNVTIGSYSYENVHFYYNGVESSFDDGESIVDGDLVINSFSDIYVNATNLSLSNGGLIFGANGQVS